MSPKGRAVVPGLTCTLWLRPGDFSLCPRQRRAAGWSPGVAYRGHQARPSPDGGVSGTSLLRVVLSPLRWHKRLFKSGSGEVWVLSPGRCRSVCRVPFPYLTVSFKLQLSLSLREKSGDWQRRHPAPPRSAAGRAAWGYRQLTPPRQSAAVPLWSEAATLDV